jgi:hypothetical protein
MNDFGNISMKFGNEFWLILFREYISPNFFAVQAFSLQRLAESIPWNQFLGSLNVYKFGLDPPSSLYNW